MDYNNSDKYTCLLRNGYMYGRNVKGCNDKCFFCKQNMSRYILLSCGCKFHGGCINTSKYCKYMSSTEDRKYDCPKCTFAANKIKTQFKESYTNPYYKMCQQRLIDDYMNICSEFNI